MLVVRSLEQLLDEWLGDIQYEKDSRAGQLYPFFVRVGCVKMATPRHPRFEMVVDLGRSEIDRMFEGLPTGNHITLIFPERWMIVHEQQAMMSVLIKNPTTIETVDIITSSPLIVGNFCKEQLRILTWEDDMNHNGRL